MIIFIINIAILKCYNWIILYPIFLHYPSKTFLVFWRLDCNYKETDCAIKRHMLEIAHG